MYGDTYSGRPRSSVLWFNWSLRSKDFVGYHDFLKLIVTIVPVFVAGELVVMILDALWNDFAV
jgi:hypothetical protein